MLRLYADSSQDHFWLGGASCCADVKFWLVNGVGNCFIQKGVPVQIDQVWLHVVYLAIDLDLRKNIGLAILKQIFLRFDLFFNILHVSFLQ